MASGWTQEPRGIKKKQINLGFRGRSDLQVTFPSFINFLQCFAGKEIFHIGCTFLTLPVINTGYHWCGLLPHTSILVESRHNLIYNKEN